MTKENRQKQNIIENTFRKTLAPFEEFIHRETSSGIVLLFFVAAALIVANSPLYPTYEHLLHAPFTIGIPGFSLSYSLHHWINDGLMALFFFVVGLEVKREILIGELSHPRQAMLPIAMAIGGMVVPAGLYLLCNQSGDSIAGWGIPMATDIAFALGVVALLGRRVPKPLVGLLLSIAIVDDLGAVLVIAFFYTDTISVVSLFFAVGCLLVLVVINIASVRSPIPYTLIGGLMWLFMLKSGVHATLAGVLTALTIPARSSVESGDFHHHMSGLVSRFKEFVNPPAAGTSGRLNILGNARKQRLLQSMESCVHEMESPLQRLEHGLHGWVAFVVVPVFAFANAGIPIQLEELGHLLTQPVSLGIIFGLVFGKTLGIFGLCQLVIHSGLGRLPAGVSHLQILGIAMLAGIGFTMSIFIGTLAFGDNGDLLNTAKIGIVFGSVVAGSGGFWLLTLATRGNQAGPRG